MNYESIILELMERVQVLETEVKELKSNVPKEETKDIGISATQRARDYIEAEKARARDMGKREIILVAGDIQKALGIKNRPVIICNAMKQLMRDNDEVLFAPPSGNSTKVKIKYYL